MRDDRFDFFFSLFPPRSTFSCSLDHSIAPSLITASQKSKATSHGDVTFSVWLRSSAYLLTAPRDPFLPSRAANPIDASQSPSHTLFGSFMIATSHVFSRKLRQSIHSLPTPRIPAAPHGWRTKDERIRRGIMS